MHWYLPDITSELELGRPEGKKLPNKRVNGIFWILLINLGIYVADHVFQVLWFSFPGKFLVGRNIFQSVGQRIL